MSERIVVSGDLEQITATVDGSAIHVVVSEVDGGGGGGADLSDALPAAPGTPAAGTDTKASRSDHVHAPPTPGQIGAATPGDVASAIAAASLDGGQIQSGFVPDVHIPASIARDSEVAAAVTAHTSAVDPHGDRAHADAAAAAVQAASQPVDSDLTAIAALSTTSFGRALLEQADAAALRTVAGLGTAATRNVGSGAGTVTAGDDSRLADARTPTAHVHTATDITAGTVSTARLGSGTADSTVFLRGDQTWAAVTPGASALNDLTDVDTATDPPATDDVLAWDGVTWTPATLTALGAPGLSNATPADLGTAAAGVSTEASRADHVHDMPTAAQVGALPDNTALLALGETSTTAYRGDRGKTAYDHSQITTGNPHGTTAADVGAEPAGVVSDVPQSTFIGAPIAPFTGATATAATAPGTLLLSPVAHSWTGVARFWWDITATSATSGQTLHLVVYSPGTGGRPGSLLWSQAFDAATVQQATTTTPASVIPNRGWWGVLFPSTLAGNVTMRFGYPAVTTASNFSGAFGNFACSFAATSQGSTPASSISSYTFGTTPAATVLGASHALRPVCPLIFLGGS